MAEPEINSAPRGDEPRGVIAHVGRAALERSAFVASALTTLIRALVSAFAPGLSAGQAVREVTFRQVFFTGVQGLPSVTTTALILGATIILQTRVVAPGMPGELVGAVHVAVVLRELAPLTTALIVASRSGTAISTELGNMQANLEVMGLTSMGVDPARYVVQPRIVAATVGVLVLTVYFSVLSVLGSMAAAAVLGGPSLDGLKSGISATLGWGDLVLYVVKAGGCGVLVGWLCCHFGLQVRGSITDVPRMSGQAVIWSILGCVVYSFAVTVSYYAVVSSNFEPG